MLLVALCLIGGSTIIFAQTVNWAMSSSGTYSGDMELSSNTSVVSVKLGNGTWAYNSTWGVEETGVGDNVKPTLTNNIPTAGNYLKIVPNVDIAMSLDTRSSANHNFVLVEESAPTTYIINVRDRYYKTYQLGTLASPLKAGKTYYAYSTGGANLGYRAFSATTIHPYTLHYVDDSATPVTIKSDVVYNGLYGSQVTASADDMAQITFDNNLYVYSSGNETITLGTGTNEITLVYSKVSSANYTIKYVDGEGNAIADDIVLESYVNAEVTASGENLPTYIKKNDVKYKYASGNTVLTVTSTEANNVITLVYNEASMYSYTIKTSLGGTITSGSDYENETVYYHYPQYVNNNGTLYSTGTDDTGVDNNGYKSKLVLDADNKLVTKTYSQAVTNVLFFAEGESIFTRGTGSNADTRLSMGAGGYASSKTAIVTLPAGTYNIKLVNRCNSTVTGKHKFYKGDEEEPFFSADGNGYNAERNTATPFVLDSPTTIYMQGGDNNNMVDWLCIHGSISNDVEIVGSLDFSNGYFGDFSDTPLWINAGETGYFKFVNVNNGGETYQNWEFFAATEASQNLTILRADKHINTGDGTITWDDYNTGTVVADLDKATVELTVTLNNGTLNFTANITKADGTEMSPYTYTQSGFEVSKLKLYVSCEGSWLELQKEAVKKTVSAAKWATYCGSNALDFSGVEGLTAFIVTGGADGKLTTTEVSSVPAGTGVLLKGAAGDYMIPIVASSATDVTGNKLTGVTTQTQIDAEAGYVLMNGSEGVAFYKNANAFTVGANTAYLPANFDATQGARAFFSFGDDATDIRLIENGELKKENSVYDLQGRRIDGSRMNSGIYIHNGRKVFVK